MWLSVRRQNRAPACVCWHTCYRSSNCQRSGLRDGGVARDPVGEGSGSLGSAIDGAVYEVCTCDEDLGLPRVFATITPMQYPHGGDDEKRELSGARKFRAVYR